MTSNASAKQHSVNSRNNSSNNVSYQKIATNFEQEHSTLLDDDYNIAQNKMNWSKIPSNILQQSQKLLLKSLEGKENEMLAPSADICAYFEDEEQALAIAQSFIRVLELRTVDQLTYILALLCAILQSDNKRGKVFLQLNNPQLLQSFSRVWGRNDVNNYCAGKAAICCSIIYQYGTQEHYQNYRSLCSWMLREFKNKNDKLLEPLYALKGIIKNIHFQAVFCNNSGIQRLHRILNECPDHRQVLYLTVYSLWSISFTTEYKIKDGGLLNGPLIEKLCSLVKHKISIKVTRVILALFENLCNFGDFNEMVILFDLYPCIQQMSEQESKLDDDELKASIKQLIEVLENSVRTLSSFERYCMEISTQKLIKGPCHTTKFWKRYARRLEDDNYKLVRALVHLLDSTDVDTVQWACYDIGQWARFYADAKSVIEKLNAKYKLMNLIERDEPIKTQALNAVQSILIKNWRLDENESDKKAKE